MSCDDPDSGVDRSDFDRFKYQEMADNDSRPVKDVNVVRRTIIEYREMAEEIVQPMTRAIDVVSAPLRTALDPVTTMAYSAMANPYRFIMMVGNAFSKFAA